MQVLPFGDRGSTFSLRLARLPQNLRVVRHELLRWLDLRGVQADDAAEIVLACSEACANAVEHPPRGAGPYLEVTAIRRPAEVEVEVRDFGSWGGAPGNDESRGRGLAIMRALTDVEISTDSHGTRVTMRRRLGRKAA